MTPSRRSPGPRGDRRDKAGISPGPLYSLQSSSPGGPPRLVLITLGGAGGRRGRAAPAWLRGGDLAQRLKARKVTVCPDADAAGFDYARAVAKMVTRAGAEFVSSSRGRGRGAEVSVALPPPDVADGWYAADALAEGWTTERAVSKRRLSAGWPMNMMGHKIGVRLLITEALGISRLPIGMLNLQ